MFVVTNALAFSAPRVAMEASVPYHSPETSLWAMQEKPSPTTLLNLTVALKIDPERRADLERVFWEVSDPRHRNYGNHLKVKALKELLAVPEKRIDLVSQAFQKAGARVLLSNVRDTMTVEMTAAAADALLQTDLHWFSHKVQSGAARLLRSPSGYSLPAHVAEEVTMVGELLQFPRLRTNPAKKEAAGTVESTPADGSWPNSCPSECADKVNPAVLASRYKFPPSTAADAVDGNAMAVAEFQGQYYKPTDLSFFSDKCSTTVAVDKTIGGNRPSAGVEAELDIEFIKAVSPEVPLTVVYASQYSLLNWATQITDLDSSPPVHSVSYGNDEKQQTSAEYMLTCNTAFMKAGAAGISILFASGDQGVCGREGCGIGWVAARTRGRPTAAPPPPPPLPSPPPPPLPPSLPCLPPPPPRSSARSRTRWQTSPRPRRTLAARHLESRLRALTSWHSIFSKKSFKPDFPGGSPYITVVGGTDFATRSVVGEEAVWPDGGGGFSNTFPIPSYQAEAVAAYKSSPDANLPPAYLWNNTGRGYPDIAALGGQKNSYCVAIDGAWEGVAGTSAACPVAAGIFAKVNGARLKAGKKVLGFLNPFIYQNPSAFQDVTQGMNNANQKYGFTAIKGWDAASGFGTPDYEALTKAALALR